MGGKRDALDAHCVLLLNRDLLRQAGEGWGDEDIRARTRQLIDLIIEIWPVPSGHRSAFAADRTRRRRDVDLADLISSGVLTPGMTLHPRKRGGNAPLATLLSDGRIEIEGQVFANASPTARHVAGRPVNGWWYFLVDPVNRVSLKSVRRDFISSMDLDVEEDGDEADDEED